MLITHLHAQNFMALGSVDLPNLHTMGLTLLQGVNQDDTSASSNGAGKSSIVDAISWCLFGETARGESGDTVVNEVAGKNCMVKVNIEDGADRYSIIRYRKHKTGKNSLTVFKLSPVLPSVGLGGPTVDLTKGTNELTQDMIVKILGCTADVFNAAIYAGQDRMPDLPGMTDKNLKLIVEQAAGVDRLQRAYDIARAKVADQKNGVAIMTGDVSRLQAQRDTMAASLATTEASAANWDAAHKEKMALAQSVLVKAGFDRIKAESDALALKAQLPSIEARIAESNAKLSGEEAMKNKLADLVLIERKAQSDLTVATTNAKNQAEQIRHAKLHLAAIDSKVGSPCGECGKHYAGEDMAGARIAQEARIEEMTGKLRAQMTTVDAAKKALASASESVSAFRASMHDTSAIVAAMREGMTQREQVRAKLSECDRIIALEGRASAQHDELAAQTNPFIENIEKAKEKIKTTGEQVAERSASLTHLQAELDLATEAAEVFSPSGVRGHILDTVTPYLNERTGHYLGVLSDGNIQAVWTTITATAKGDAREKFSIQVSNTKGAKNFGGLSGGEKRKVRLACAMALQDLVASRATKPISMFIADEIDHALDEAGLERLMAILEEKAREKGTVMVVSHNDLKSWISRVLVVTKKDGVSTIEEVV